MGRGDMGRGDMGRGDMGRGDRGQGDESLDDFRYANKCTNSKRENDLKRWSKRLTT
ncbi:hypothetical protein GCM10023156_33580 [Novipirellula rosea]|uniref:Uncharacterized protein n=1 Tax=Novipirellula rosea TaxID=1031540 RepID=A0ABP8MW65_9BACT